MRNRRFGLRKISVGAAAIFLVVSACSGDESGSGASSTIVTTTTPSTASSSSERFTRSLISNVTATITGGVIPNAAKKKPMASVRVAPSISPATSSSGAPGMNRCSTSEPSKAIAGRVRLTSMASPGLPSAARWPLRHAFVVRQLVIRG